MMFLLPFLRFSLRKPVRWSVKSLCYCLLDMWHAYAIVGWICDSLRYSRVISSKSAWLSLWYITGSRYFRFDLGQVSLFLGGFQQVIVIVALIYHRFMLLSAWSGTSFRYSRVVSNKLLWLSLWYITGSCYCRFDLEQVFVILGWFPTSYCNWYITGSCYFRCDLGQVFVIPVSYTHLRAHET